MTKPNSSPVASPKGTRDLYPDQLLRQNYITRLWRDTALRHGFEEINGPTFEMLELYTRKSGEGIVGELFRFRREGGEDDYALRPEFTPTLARMYAAKAASLPSPTKWFSIGPYFRAEKPQRGRLREFLQWNVDVLGGDELADDADTVACAAELLIAAGLRATDIRIDANHRGGMESLILSGGVSEENVAGVFALLDAYSKLSEESILSRASSLGVSESLLRQLRYRSPLTAETDSSTTTSAHESIMKEVWALRQQMERRSARGWVRPNFHIVRGLAYYTGTVFEVIAEGERAIAGGGRYDNLIELFGGPPTPAVGFGMGDVVLGLLLDDKGLMPHDGDLLEALSRRPASLRPEAFVIADEEQEGFIEPLLANLRRGIEFEDFKGRPWDYDRYKVRPLHARRSYKRKRLKQKREAEAKHARFLVTIEDADKIELRDMGSSESLTPNKIPGWEDNTLAQEAHSFSLDPRSPVYVGRAIAYAMKRWGPHH